MKDQNNNLIIIEIKYLIKRSRFLNYKDWDQNN